jgi:gluconolactonase
VDDTKSHWVYSYQIQPDGGLQFKQRYFHCILPTPNHRVANLTFGGQAFDTIYADCGDKIYKRRVKVKGAPSFTEPIKPAAPHL